jgi:hypothetical protein
MNAKLVTLSCALVLASCAGRSPEPIALAQAQDTQASCRALQAEVDENTTKIGDLGSEGNWKVAQNVSAVVVGLVFWPALFAMDFKGAAGTEKEALEARNRYLSELSIERCDGQETRLVGAQ